MGRAGRCRAVSLIGVLPLALACTGTADQDFRGEVIIGAAPAPARPEAFRGTRSDFAAAMAAATDWEMKPGARLHVAASFSWRLRATQVSFHIFDVTEMSEELAAQWPGEPRFSDVIDVAPGAWTYIGEVDPEWLRPCRRYQFAFFSERQRLATGRLRTKPCGRAIDELRGGVLAYVRAADRPFTPPPRLAQFEQSLADYTRLIGGGFEQRVASEGPVRFGIRAALAKPLGAKDATLVVADETNGGFIVARLAINADPTWDTLAAEWTLSPSADWLKSGHRYALSLRQNSTDGRPPLATGRFRYFHREQ